MADDGLRLDSDVGAAATAMRESAAAARFFRALAGAPAGAGWLSVGRVGTSGPVGRGPGRRVRWKLESRWP